ncbi:MAG: carbon monoxide dehydrogenase subunit G, partial [Pseudomonadota bacterium]
AVRRIRVLFARMAFRRAINVINCVLFIRKEVSVDIEGEYTINAPIDAVWNDLNDTEVLRECIPGCESLEQVGDDEFIGEVVAKYGPVKAKFKAKVALTNVEPPKSYTLVGEGKGGAAGFGKGSADVSLSEVADGTLLRYVAKVNVGGKLAQIGAKMISSTTRKLSDQFFTAFCGRYDS